MRSACLPLLFSLAFSACGGDEAETFPAGLALTELSDAQIVVACAAVPEQDEICGSATVVESSPALCGAALGAWRSACENSPGCPTAQDVVDCWMKAPCDRRDSNCPATPPDPARCWTLDLAACDGDPACQTRDGFRYDPQAQCFGPREAAYCAPAGGCSNAFAKAQDDAGACWGTPSLCDLPPAWNDGVSCPAQSEYPACP